MRRWRQTEVELEQAQLQALFAELQRLQRSRSDLRAQLDAAGEAAQDGLDAGVRYDSARFAGLQAFREFVQRREREISAQESGCQRKIEEQRRQLTLARRNAQVLERLKEKRFDQWNRAYGKELEETAAELHLANWRR